MMLRHFIAGFALAAATFAVASEAGAREIVYLEGHTGQVVSREGKAKPTKAQLAEASTYKGKASGITFTAVYMDGAGVGFNDTTHGTNRKAVVTAVFAYLDTVLNHPGGTCEVLFDPSQFDGTGALASASTGFFTTPPGYQGGIAFEHITTGVDPDPGDSDIFVQFDFGYTWNNSTGPVGPGQIDMFTVMLHEITHGLGIASMSNSSGGSAVGTGVFTNWDALLHRSSPSEVKYWDNSGNLTVPVGALTGGDSTSIFKGNQANIAFGQYPPIYTPASFAAGSSISHFQQNAPIPSNTVMRPGVAPNVEIREFHALEIGALKDIGYTISSADDWKMY